MYVVCWRYVIYYTNLITHNGMASPKFKVPKDDYGKGSELAEYKERTE